MKAHVSNYCYSIILHISTAIGSCGYLTIQLIRIINNIWYVYLCVLGVLSAFWYILLGVYGIVNIILPYAWLYTPGKIIVCYKLTNEIYEMNCEYNIIIMIKNILLVL